MQYQIPRLGCTSPSCSCRGKISECLSVSLIVALIITVGLVGCEEPTKEGGTFASAGGSQQRGGGGRVSGHQGGRDPPSNLMDKTLLTSEYSTFDGDGLPGTQEEFKIEIPAGKEECFFQWLKNGTHLDSSFQVLRGADRNLDFSLRSPDGDIIKIEPWTRRGVISHFAAKEGVYAICLSNTMSKFTRKTVQVYFQTQFTADWESYSKEVHEYHTELRDMTKSFQTVQSRMYTVKVTQAMHRMHFSWDEYNVSQMKATVQNRSLVISGVIVIVAIFQVFFLRRLFRVTIVTPTAKPRA